VSGLWANLVPLIAGSALVPIQIIITLLLLRSTHGRGTAIAWVAGQTLTKLVQGLIFGLVISSAGHEASSGVGPGLVVSVVMLIMAVLFYVTALRQALAGEDPDAPPPKWLTMTETMTPARAFLFSAGYMAVAAKFWVFTLGAISAIGAANLSTSAAIGTYLLFVALAESIILVIVIVAFVAPTRSASTLERLGVWLRSHNRVLVIVLGVVFGTWFLVKTLQGLGVL
jgi:hypothetical protein